jgi:hypothetical protein
MRSNKKQANPGALRNKKETKSDIQGVYYYKNKPYKILYKSKIKLKGEWKPCVIYKCLYKNPDGLIWVRDHKEFFELFSREVVDDGWEEL